MRPCFSGSCDPRLAAMSRPVSAVLVLGALLALPPVTRAQAVVVDEPGSIVVGSADAQRQVILATLDRAEVGEAARTAGFDLDAARAHVRLLEGEPLARAAGHAREVERAIDGSISSTTLIILLVITILLIVILQS